MSRLPVGIRLTLWYSTLLAAALMLFSVAVYLFTAHALLGNLDTTLTQRVDQVGVDVTDGRLSLKNPSEQPDAPFVPAVLIDSSGRASGGPIPTDIQLWLQHSSALSPAFTAESFGNYRLATAPVQDNGKIVGHVLVWQSLKPVNDARRSLLLVILATGPIILLTAGLGGLALARRAMAPVSQLTKTASAITATDLHGRVPVGPAKDQLSELAATFNAMIDRLESAVQRERRFTADASHELRAPLSVIRAEATLALDRPRDSGSYREALATIDEQAAAMEELISGLLLLARTETLGTVQVEEVALSHVVATAVQQCRQARADTDVRIVQTVPENLVVAGSASLLIRAVRNVVENAVKVSPRNSVVRVTASGDGDAVVLTVADNGPGIAPGFEERIFEAFCQLQPARTPGESHGLGLAICRRIVEAHAGKVAVESNPGEGSRFRIVLPLLATRVSSSDGHQGTSLNREVELQKEATW